MLQQLQIKNYAIIESLEVNFYAGLNIITGETGAGKSIIMGALSLILGERADSSVLLDASNKCIIEGVFKINQNRGLPFLQAHGLDGDEEIIVRREIAVNGKSRAFINDTPVTLGILKQMSSLLVDLHRQFDTLDLNSHHFQREVIDALAGSYTVLTNYKMVFKNFCEIAVEIKHLKEVQANANKELDYKKFLFDELEEAAFSSEEIETTESELKIMNNAEGIKTTLNDIYFSLEENENAVVQNLKEIQHRLNGIRNMSEETESLYQRLHSAEIELRDIASEISSLNDKVYYDDEKIGILNERMTLGYHLLKKHNASNTAQLLQIKEQLSAELFEVTHLSEAIQKAEEKYGNLRKEAYTLASQLAVLRQKAIKPFETKVNELLHQVGMPNARIKVAFTEKEELNEYGADSIEIMFNANKSSRFEPLSKVASGGELSRIMLIIKSLVAKSMELPTLIFDEIDSGISGEAARQVGIIIKELARHHQIISITHQPQIAARADTHFYVYKEMRKNKINTSIKILSDEEKLHTIAVMLSGEKPTAAAFENAREMMAH